MDSRSAPRPSQSDRVTPLLFAGAPACFLGGWLLMRPIEGQAEPGVWWTVAHAVWLAGFLMFAAMGLRFRRIGGARTRGGAVVVNLSAATVLLSSAANLVQLALDLVAGFRAANRTELRDAFAELREIPGFETVVQGVGAQIIFVGLVIFAVQAAVVRRAGVGSSALVAVATAVMATGMGFGRNHWLVPAGMACLLAGLALMGRELQGPAAGALPRGRGARPRPAP